MRRAHSSRLLLLVLVAACGSSGVNDPGDCFIDPAPISPTPDRLLVGDTVTLTASLSDRTDCLPSNLEPVVWRWSSEDPRVATVDSASGLLTAVAAGDVVIRVQHARVASVTSAFLLDVVGR